MPVFTTSERPVTTSCHPTGISKNFPVILNFLMISTDNKKTGVFLKEGNSGFGRTFATNYFKNLVNATRLVGVTGRGKVIETALVSPIDRLLCGLCLGSHDVVIVIGCAIHWIRVRVCCRRINH